MLLFGSLTARSRVKKKKKKVAPNRSVAILHNRWTSSVCSAAAGCLRRRSISMPMLSYLVDCVSPDLGFVATNGQTVFDMQRLWDKRVASHPFSPSQKWPHLFSLSLFLFLLNKYFPRRIKSCWHSNETDPRPPCHQLIQQQQRRSRGKWSTLSGHLTSIRPTIFA